MSLTNLVVRTFGRIVWLPLLCLPAAAQTTSAAAASTDVASWGVYETREFRAENGRRVRFTSRGNLAAFEAPYGFEHIANGARAREGYVVAYSDPATGASRVVFDVNDLHSRALGSGRDLVPYVFRGPADGTTFAINTIVRAAAIVDTSDGVLRLTHQFEWRAGSGRVKITTTVTSRLSSYVPLQSFKRHADMDLDGDGAYGAALTNDWARADNGILISIRCLCAPPSPPSPLTPEAVSRHVMSFTGAPAPAYKMIKPSGDLTELRNAGPVTATDLPGLRRGENNQATLIFSGGRLAAGAPQSFTAEYQVE